MLKNVLDFIKYLFKENKEYYGFDSFGKFGLMYDKTKAIVYHDLETDTIHKIEKIEKY